MAKDFNLEDLGIVSLNELGIDTSNWQINVNDLYQIEYDRCHRKDVDFNSTREKTIGSKEGEFTSWGEIGNFDWVALTQIYSSVIFKNLSSDKKRQNEIHHNTICMGYQLGQYLNSAIQNNSMLGIRLRRGKIAIPDTSEIAWNGIHEHTMHMTTHLRKFFGLDPLSGVKLAIENNQLVAQEGKLMDLKGKDVFLPFIYANKDSINLYGQVANILIKAAQADTVTGLFITRIMPTMDGRNPNSLAQDEYVPILSPFFGMEIPPLGY